MAEPETHWIDADVTGRRVRALCGRLVYQWAHANEPSCSWCQIRLEARAEEQAQLEAQWRQQIRPGRP